MQCSIPFRVGTGGHNVRYHTRAAHRREGGFALSSFLFPVSLLALSSRSLFPLSNLASPFSPPPSRLPLLASSLFSLPFLASLRTDQFAKVVPVENLSPLLQLPWKRRQRLDLYLVQEAVAAVRGGRREAAAAGLEDLSIDDDLGVQLL